ncbi:MAG TPA: hypothetical protein VHW43_03080, partial [Puia sp.]|nr:hypothetical protein [Puia sp.]
PKRGCKNREKPSLKEQETGKNIGLLAVPRERRCREVHCTGLATGVSQQGVDKAATARAGNPTAS